MIGLNSIESTIFRVLRVISFKGIVVLFGETRCLCFEVEEREDKQRLDIDFFEVIAVESVDFLVCFIL